MRRTKTTRRRNPEPIISDELMERAWGGHLSDSLDAAAWSIIEDGYDRDAAPDHPDLRAMGLGRAEDLDPVMDYIQENLGVHELSAKEKRYVIDWWFEKLKDASEELGTRKHGERFVYIDHWPKAPERVYRADIGMGKYADYVIVPSGDGANPSRRRIITVDVAVPASRLSIADLTRLTRPAPKTKRQRAR